MVYRTDDGAGVIEIHFGEAIAPTPCGAPRLDTDTPLLGEDCGRVGGTICDAPGGIDFFGKTSTCDLSLCERHATHVEGRTRDYCPRHKHLAEVPACRS